MNKTEKQPETPQVSVSGRFVFKIPFFHNLYLLRPHASNRMFVLARSKQYMNVEFGEEAIKKNGEMNMKNRQFGFEDGYNACLEDLGIQLTYKNDR